MQVFAPIPRRCSLLGALAFLTLPSAALAQASDTIFACYVPATRTVYRIRDGGLDPNCAGPSGGPNPHVEFTRN